MIALLVQSVAVFPHFSLQRACIIYFIFLLAKRRGALLYQVSELYFPVMKNASLHVPLLVSPKQTGVVE
jgi:hypothetical protein